MAAAATKTRSSGKPATTSRKASDSSSEKGGQPLVVYYSSTMKPNRVTSLVVEVPRAKKKKSDDDDGPSQGMVVIRPVIPGALVTPSEQRLDLRPGHHVQFHVTAVARGRLPRARVDVFAPNRPVEAIPLPMKARTQRAALVLFLLAFLVPMFLISYTWGKLRPEKQVDAEYFTDPMTKDLPPIPVFNRKSEGFSEFLKDNLQLQFDTIASFTGDIVFLGYDSMKRAFVTHRWIPNAIGAGFLFLALIACLLNKPRRKVLRRNLRLKLGSADEESRDAATLEPI